MTVPRRLATLSLLSLLLAIGLLQGAGVVRADDKSQQLLRAAEASAVRIVEQSGAAVVSIIRVKRQTTRVNDFASGLRGFQIDDTENPLDPEYVPSDFGAGVVIDTPHARYPRLILTNYHVVRGGPVFGREDDDAQADLYVSIRNRPRFRTAIVAADPHSDLAVVAIDPRLPVDGLVALTPRENAPRKGQFVYALGNPWAIARDGSASVAWGLVGNILRHPAPGKPDFENDFRVLETVHHFGTLVQVSVPLPAGTSGGALLNLNGDLIGLTTSLAALDGYEQAAGYAIPFNAGFLRVIDELTRGYEVNYGFLGVRPANATSADLRGMPEEQLASAGAVALSVTSNSPALHAGLQADDVVLSVNGTPVGDSFDLMREVALIGPDQPCEMSVWRPRERRVVTRTATLGKWPVQNDEDIIATASPFPEWRGIQVDFSTARARYLRNGRSVHFQDAVLVTSVDEDRNGLRVQPGDFISHVAGERIATPAEFHAAVDRHSDEKVTLQTTDGRTIEIEK